MPKITSFVDPWGKVDANRVEECLIYSLGLCLSLNHCGSVGRLRALWAAIHRPEAPFIDKEWLMALLPAQPHAGGKRSAAKEEGEDDRLPSKRARMEGDSD